jgi:hypothetical protein
VDAAFQILRAHYAQFVMCAAIGYVPLLIVRLAVIGDPTRFLGGVDPQAASNALAWTGVVALLGSWLTFTLMSSILLVCASQAYLGDEVDVESALRRSLPRVPHTLVAGFLRYVLMLLALLAFVVPLLYVVARYFAVTAAIVLENAGVRTAFSRSSVLSRGRKWHILNTIGLVAVIYWVIVFGISILASLSGSFVLTTVVSAVVTVLVYPVIAIAEALLYYDARIQSEGLDIELMTSALSPPPSAELPAR